VKPIKKAKETVAKRPAETAGVSLSVVVGAALALFGVDVSPAQAGAIVALLSAVPAVVSWLKDR
jgi:hypothetical protein